MSLYK